jgi:uncharacterized membrane protein HdeD (DUF308 family)
MTSEASVPSRAPFALARVLCDNWWLFLLRGLAAIVVGVLAFIWPGVTLVTLVLFYGAFTLVDGVFALIAAVRGGAAMVPRWWLALVGLLGIVVGIGTFVWPGVTALVLVLFIAAWAIVTGVFQIIGAIQLRKEIDNEWLLILNGVASILFGVVLFAMPGPGALVLVWIFGIYAVVYGILMIGFAFRLRRHRSAG